MTTKTDLLAAREVMLAYLRLRMEMQDWHGVRDAAADLEQIDAKIEILDEGWGE